jgi:hypothetical protein
MTEYYNYKTIKQLFDRDGVPRDGLNYPSNLGQRNSAGVQVNRGVLVTYWMKNSAHDGGSQANQNIDPYRQVQVKYMGIRSAL